MAIFKRNMGVLQRTEVYADASRTGVVDSAEIMHLGPDTTAKTTYWTFFLKRGSESTQANVYVVASNLPNAGNAANDEDWVTIQTHNMSQDSQNYVRVEGPWLHLGVFMESGTATAASLSVHAYGV